VARSDFAVETRFGFAPVLALWAVREGSIIVANYLQYQRKKIAAGPTLIVKYILVAALKEAISNDDIFTVLGSYLPDQVLVRGTLR
jgi:hypothetical protein